MKTKEVHFKLKPETLGTWKGLLYKLEAESMTAALRMSIEIADMVTKCIADGGQVILETPGKNQVIKVPGMIK